MDDRTAASGPTDATDGGRGAGAGGSDAADATVGDASAGADPVGLPADALAPFPRFSLYNSPYPAHDRGRAVDLYPTDGVGHSPVAGEVLDTRTVRCPDRSYAVDHDHLILLDAGAYTARVLHVDPAVSAGDRVGVGDPLGETVRSGFFGAWVDDHVHVEFRDPALDPYRASGSLPLAVDVPVRPVAWDGRGTVVETGDSYALLDAPGPDGAASDADPAYAALASADGRPLDGGLAHYGTGGTFGPPAASDREAAGGDGPAGSEPDGVELLGERVGTADGRDVAWGDVAVCANGERVTGLSLFAARGDWGTKLVTRPEAGDPEFAVGDEVRVSVERVDDPVRLA
ncbi:hypothetical protein [Candidatus Halobonum tyrrellensis]|uniref:Uncharacterized protein n=1 Tax=Candidatus Halobonum tyrrellensis G22 TaxID=1324957 RepID=V4HHZ6_9EURY|nr:hypothetical protein [Candidatus Halobonum tyrrellensis]ESP87534.1 hypothetical protein K933_13716 [Candidatus Halobonum tyrrellensis G22]